MHVTCSSIALQFGRDKYQGLPPPTTQPSSSRFSMQQALETHSKPPPGLLRGRLRPRKTCPSNVELQASPQIFLTVAEQERLRINLPTELWREVMCHAASVEHEFETCGFDGRNHTFEHSASYKAEWYQASRIRLNLVLVCKTWNSLASEFLYRSILITHAYSAREFVRLVLQLVNNGMIKYVLRVSVYPFDGSKALELSLLNAIAQCPNLRVLEIQIYNTFTPKANQIYITTLRAHLKEWSAFEALAFLPHLQYLQFSFNNQQSISSRVKLSQLKTLHVVSYASTHSFYEWLDLPALHTLILGSLHQTSQLPLMQHFLPHIRVLGIDQFTARPPPNNPSAPRPTSFTCREPFGTNWRNLPHVVPLNSIEEVHLSLEAPLLRRSRVWQIFSGESSISSMFAHMKDERVMSKLSYVYTDLTVNTLRVLEPPLKIKLLEWLICLMKRKVMVMTYIKTSKYEGHRYYSLEDIWDAEPHLEFWAPTGNADEIHRWDILALVTGRENLTWKVTNDGSECQWFRGIEWKY